MRQAVVVIHGIGEHKPMDTLRGFVDGVLGEPIDPDRPRYHSKPDHMSESFELRKLLVPQTRSRPITDFYEYYWAFHVEETKYRHIVGWLRTILLRSPRNVPRRLLLLWILSWGLIALTTLAAVGFVPFLEPLRQVVETGQTLPAWLLTLLLVPAIHVVVLSFIGDAARYLSPRPVNISTRHAIRADGVELLRRLHESQAYDRIVLVGHSLGAVIAYDLLKHLWQEMNDHHDRPLHVDQSALAKLEQAGASLCARPTAAEVTDFQATQRELWLEQRRHGNPWLVTDLITIGSPLVHAELLLANGQSDLARRRAEYELPTCPPQPDDGRHYAYRGGTYEVEGQKRTLRILHHGALFAPTRWTNLYFPGDFVGGPLQPVLGPGIRDVEVTTGGLGRLLAHTPAGHVRYWHPEGEGSGAGEQPTLQTLRGALALESKDWLPART